MTMIENGSSNDVKIVPQDGEILANKDVLIARYSYFSTMFGDREIMFAEAWRQILLLFCEE